MIVSGRSQSADRRAPGMDFQHRRLHQPHQPVEIVDADQVVFRVLRILDQHDVGVEPLPGVLLEELLAADAARAAQQRQRSADDIGRDVAPDLRVVVAEPLLGDALVRPVDAVGMGELHRAHGLLPGWLALVRADLRSFRRLAHHVDGCLVLAQPPEGGMAQMAIRGPGAKLDLGHQFGPHEADLADLLRCQAFGKRALVDPHPVEAAEQLLRHTDRKPGSDAPDMRELAVFVDAHHQRADRPARCGGRHVAGDDEFLPRRAFRLDPALAAPRPIGRVRPLRDHAFQAEPAGMAQHEVAILVEMVAEPDEAWFGADHWPEDRLALRQRQAGSGRSRRDAGDRRHRRRNGRCAPR